MRQGQLLRCLGALACSLLVPSARVGALQDSPQQSTSYPSASHGSTAVRVCLRLQDESAYLGPAKIRIIRDEGTEVPGKMEAQGEMVFPDLSSGTYTLETSAPGFSPVKQELRIEAGHRLLTRTVIMKAKPFQGPTPQASPDPSFSMVQPAEVSWMPPGVDEEQPWVDREEACPLADVVKGAGYRMTQFVEDLEKFTARERVEHQAIDANGWRHSPEIRDFNYVVMVSRTSMGVFLLDEYRNGSSDPEQFPAHIATQGMPAIALLFHPILASDFTFTCEGLGGWEGRSAWQVHFVQRPDRPGRILSYSTGGRYSSLPLKGRAWIDPGTMQVLRIETELVRPLAEVGLTVDHVAISYQPVQFTGRDEKLWLPRTVDLYVERRGRRYYRRHTFKDFRLFTVETTQNIQLAKESYRFTNESDHDVRGVLTVTPVSGAKFETVSLSFIIPANSSVHKLVGPGKDVGIPVAAVQSATFAHDGPQDSVRVDAHLSRESTVDVISGMPLPLKP